MVVKASETPQIDADETGTAQVVQDTEQEDDGNVQDTEQEDGGKR